MMRRKRKELTKFYLKIRSNNLILSDLTYMPRWVILLIDTCLVAIAYLVSYLLFRSTLANLDIPQVLPFIVKYFIYISVNTIFFIIFRLHYNLVRHSSVLDAVKLFLTLFVAHFTLLTIEYGQFLFSEKSIFHFVTLLLSFMLSFVLMLMFRLTVKYVFERYRGLDKKVPLKRTVIFGVEHQAVGLAEALMKENPARFNIVGFVDLDSKVSDKRIIGLPIYHYIDSLNECIEDLDFEVLIIATRQLSEAQKFSLVEFCSHAHIKIFTSNLISDVNDQDFQGNSRNIRDLKIEDLLQRPTIQLDVAHVAKSLYDKVIFVTGGAGSIGSEIVTQLGIFNPRKIVIIDQAETPMHDLDLMIRSKFPNLKYEIRIGDITDALDMDRIFREHKPHIIYHAAAYKHVPMMEKNPIQAVMANVVGVRNIADLSVKYKAERFIFVSTDKAVNPTNIMGATKKIAEIYTQSLFFSLKDIHANSQTKFITTRFGNVLGSNGSVVPLFQKQIEKGGPITLTHPEVTRFFMTIPEACQLVLQAGSLGEGGEIFLFDMGQPIKILDLAKKMIQLSGLIPNQDIQIKFVGLRPGEKLYEELYDEYAETVPTHHKKILKVIDRVPNHQDVLAQLSDLLQFLHIGDCEGIVSQIKKMVPEYHNPNETKTETVNE
uniref:polysaccharide biosynthesis protein n=1 Tax=Flavobacterium sp. TaxID=239 RepID=UPI004049D3A5